VENGNSHSDKKSAYEKEDKTDLYRPAYDETQLHVIGIGDAKGHDPNSHQHGQS